jgi:hypothetical protein
MKDSTLMEALAGLNAWELRHFRLRLESPCFNRKATLLHLLEYLLSEGRQEQDLEAAVAAVFPDGTGSASKLRHEMTTLLGLLRNYLIELELESSPLQRQLTLVRALRKRGLEKNYRQALRESESLAPGTEDPAFSRSLFAFSLEKEKYEWEKRSSRHLDYPLHSLTTHLNAWYAGQLLQMACNDTAQAALRSRESQREEPAGWIERIIGQMPVAPREHTPETALYYHGLHMLQAPENGGQVELFRALFERHIGSLPHTEARELLMLAINHGIRRINAGDREAIRRTLDFYLFGLEKKLLHDENGALSKFTYNNVLMTFLALEEWDKASEFLETYRVQLPAKEQDNIFRYNTAVYRFRRGDFDGTLELLRNVNFPDPMYNLESRKMLLKIYYEQQAFDALESLLENLLTWLRRHGEIGYQREMYRNLARFTGRLLRLPSQDREAARRLAQKIRDTPLVAERAWLLEKVERR